MTVGQARISITIRRSADRLWLITRPYRRLARTSPRNREADLADRHHGTHVFGPHWGGEQEALAAANPRRTLLG